MRKRIQQLNKPILAKGASLVVVFVVLMVSVVAVILDMNHSFGWFAKNNLVSANGMNVQAYHSKFKVEYSLDEGADKTWTLFSGKIPLDEIKAPGDTMQISFRVTSIGTKPVTINGFGLEAPDPNEEIPKVVQEGDETVAYYLSTELQTRLTNLNGVEQDPENSFVVLRDENGVSGRIDYLAGQESIEMVQNQSVTFTVEFEFINREENQNVFKNFHESGNCERTIFISFDE